MKRFTRIARYVTLLVSFLALIPIGRVVIDWMQVSRMLAEPAAQETARAFDWVLWEEQDGVITATYVFPNGPGDKADLREGDVFYALEGQQYFNASDLTRVVENLPPGAVRTYEVLRNESFVQANVKISHYPTFLYPLSPALWRFSLWGFTLGAFVHLLGLVIAGPLALRSQRARFSLLLIGVSFLWIGANLLRLLAVEAFGPPPPHTTYSSLFQALTVVGITGWIGFPALLLRKVIGDVGTLNGGLFPGWHHVLWLPVTVLGGMALSTGLVGSIGPFTLDGLAAPILFYASCYIAVAAALVGALHLIAPAEGQERAGGWGRLGSVATFAVALLTALSVLDIVPLFGAVTNTGAGWLVVSAQLLSIAPVALVSLHTLKYGKVSQVVTRALTYAAVLGLIFFAFIGGMALLDPLIQRTDLSPHVAAGLYVVLLLAIFERVARRLRGYIATFFATERHRTRQTLRRLQEEMHHILDLETLTQQAVQTIGRAFKARLAVLFMRPASPPDPAAASSSEPQWQSSTYHPEAPYFTRRLFERIWPHLREDNRIWASNPALNERQLPDELAELLRTRHVALLVPIWGNESPLGLLVMGTRQRRGFYNLEDLDLLRSLSSQLALAVERITLVEREKALAKESAEAQLVALRAQIKPHFLFNALNTIAALIEERPDEAEATVEHLAAIFRYILQTGSEPFVSLQDEFALVRHYLEIEQARFGQDLQVEQSLPPAFKEHPAPAFAVQTLVENAVKHGLAGQRAEGQVQVTARSAHSQDVEVIVKDNGTGIPALYDRDAPATGVQPFFGLGLRNVAARLQQLYGQADLLRLTSTPEGTTARLLLPADRRAAFSVEEPETTGQPTHASP